jgi:hypothetical protein
MADDAPRKPLASGCEPKRRERFRDNESPRIGAKMGILASEIANFGDFRAFFAVLGLLPVAFSL